ncbi:MAG TPA: YggS family pyridoxal phosphate-dependent enzyme [Arsenophonus apicola]|uniref:YggS family pyridoxal phosphate-dependent enzyme n=1 Tax=Arsenophonus apicola TaxID=2879119 RepID=UPI001CDC9DCB|nr:YggS family pyridoxal phosphate-dependent enzyme [Arsenophonus apicola]UBX29597.1 YggS family pyridoxal phosphate-dependent enzyme [Arsenophonus apicola]
MNTIQQNLVNVKNSIIQAANKYHRSPEDITLLAVSKTKSCEAIQDAIDAGQYQFGENYLQEGIEKITYFSHKQDLIWHFIGALQSNKSRLVAEHFDWCHTIDRLKIAQRLNNQRPANKAPLNVLIQINISDEISKSGIAPAELDKLAAEIVLLPNLKLRGLMAIPAPNNELSQQTSIFRSMENLFNQLKKQYPDIDTLSMGMTADLDIAIACGSTLVRIGTAIFGSR